jgi:hypothetical protein
MPLRYPLCALAALLVGLAPVAGQTYTTELASENQVPPLDVSGDGSVTAAINGTELVVSGSFDNLASDFNAEIGAHIHRGAAGTNGPIEVALDPALDADNRGGSFAAESNTFTITEGLADSIRAGLAYVNIHTVDNPAGAIRGQLFPTVRINEARIDQTGSDVDEYVELRGPADLSLEGYSFVVIGDGDDGQGVIENVTSLDGQTIPDDGLFVFGQTENVGAVDFETNIAFENQQSSTLLLVQGFSGALNDDLDTDDDGTPETAPWTGIVDAVGIVSADDDDLAYGEALGFTDIGPNRTFPPGQIFRDGATGLFRIGLFGGLVFDSPGAANPDPADVQVIHNAPDTDADTVDVYVNGIQAINDLAFREATPFIALPAGVTATIDVTAADAEDNTDPVFSVTVDGGLDASLAYQVIALGVLDDTPDDDSDDDADEFTLLLDDMAMTSAMASDMVAVRAVHGSPDAPAVDVRTGGTVLFDNIEYPGISDYIEVAPASYVLDVTAADAAVGADPVASFEADLSMAGGAAVTVLASGFLTPDDEGQGDMAPGFGLLAVFADGTAALLPAATSNEGDAEAAGLAISVANPIQSAATVRFETGAAGPARLEAFDLLGRRVAVLADGVVSGAPQTATLDAGAFAPGVYVLRLTTEAGVLARTVTVVR